MAKTPTKKKPATRKKPAVKKPRKGKAPARPYLWWTLAVIALAAVLRLAMNAFDLVPPHFDEGQYWAYGHELAAGHFSKPPLVGWLIWVTTSLGGDTTFALRIGTVLGVGGLIAARLTLPLGDPVLNVLLVEGTPEDIEIKDVILGMETQNGVQNVHHVHIWQLDEQRNALEAHVMILG